MSEPLLSKLGRIADALRRRGSIRQKIKTWSDEDSEPTKLNFSITATYPFGGILLEAEWVFLAEKLTTKDFELRRPLPDVINNSIRMVGSMSVSAPRRGKPSRKGGKPYALTN